MFSRFFLLGLFFAVQLGPAGALARPLDLKQAEGAIDLALQAEFAGDYQGAQKALQALIEQAKAPEESSAKKRLEKFLGGQKSRILGFSRTAKAAQIQEAFGSLEDFGSRRLELVWNRICTFRPQLAQMLKEQTLLVRVRFTKAFPEDDFRKSLTEELHRRGLQTVATGAQAHFRLQAEVRADQASKKGRRSLVEAEVSAVLRPQKPEKAAPLARMIRRRRELRQTEVQARSFAVRRAVADVVREVRYRLQNWVLSQAHFDSGADSGSK